MRGFVTVQTAEEFLPWLDEQIAEQSAPDPLPVEVSAAPPAAFRLSLASPPKKDTPEGTVKPIDLGSSHQFAETRRFSSSTQFNTMLILGRAASALRPWPEATRAPLMRNR